jgi:glycogen debranching enzyme
MIEDMAIEPRSDAALVEADPFYIRTGSPLTDERGLILKDSDTFIVLDRNGEIRPVTFGGEGLYHEGTRYLSRLAIRIAGQRPMLLGAATRGDNAGIAVDLTNPDLIEDGTIVVPRGTLHLSRLLVLSGGVLHDRIRLRNFGLARVTVRIEIAFDADFLDIFEVRGTARERRGERLPTTVKPGEVVLAYRGLDRRVRRLHLSVEPAARLFETHAELECTLPPHGEAMHAATFACDAPERRVHLAFPAALQTVTETLERRQSDYCDIVTSNQPFNDWLRRSLADLSMMMTPTRHGDYPYAGVPWFSTPFGRDGLITAFECLWANPDVARGVLAFLAATQAHAADPDRDAMPGKILHEMRSGEMAALGEIPFDRYYGSHDATPLFVMLAAAYLERTDDARFIEQLWPALDLALTWIDRHGDLDGDGFVEYARMSPAGLVHQGWKDSHDAVSHANGELAQGGIALCEIQAYVYAAWRGAVRLASVAGQPARAAAYEKRAGAMAERFESAFWNDALGTYVLALDGEKRQCAVRASNAGHALFTGIASRSRAGSVARVLMAPEGFSGWGIRTLSTSEVRYNPMSYHNGSIWPHDNAIIAAGFARYGFHDEALAVLNAMFEASGSVHLHRLPELFCGFGRERGEGPISYPVACHPQAWASGSVLLLLQAALGVEIRAADRVVSFTRPHLPDYLDEVRLRNLRVGPHTVDLLLDRHDHDVGINVIRRTGPVEVIAIK